MFLLNGHHTRNGVDDDNDGDYAFATEEELIENQVKINPITQTIDIPVESAGIPRIPDSDPEEEPFEKKEQKSCCK